MRFALLYDEKAIGTFEDTLESGRPTPQVLGGDLDPLATYERVRSPFQRYSPDDDPGLAPNGQAWPIDVFVEVQAVRKQARGCPRDLWCVRVV